ncbi:acyltransferase family protein [Rhizobium sp. Rhizsp42]|uniref:acyltransferase family protein n=1 Tax=Rhizobium sp. Rhizsp42 TaxID=3243034 RepID=UPI0039AEA95F
MEIFSLSALSQAAFAEIKEGEILVERVLARDELLDIAKGLAILLVVLGHTIQGAYPEKFDDIFAFRVVYSFHMPLFAFLAGAAAVFWVEKIDIGGSIYDAGAAALRRVQRAAMLLLLPFVSWTILFYLSGRAEGPFGTYLLDVFLHADRSLWFLPCIFWCTVFTAAYVVVSTIACTVLRTVGLERIIRFLAPIPVQMLFAFLIWNALKVKMHSAGGLVFANDFHGGLFLFFLLGAAAYRAFTGTASIWLRAIPYIVFLGLIWFWHRTLPENLISDAPLFLASQFAAKHYAFTVAMSGSLMAVDLARVLRSIGQRHINEVLAYLGSVSLAVYAIHFYALTVSPPFVAPLAISVAAYFLLSKVPLVSTALFGK